MCNPWINCTDYLEQRRHTFTRMIINMGSEIKNRPNVFIFGRDVFNDMVIPFLGAIDCSYDVIARCSIDSSHEMETRYHKLLVSY